MLNQVASNKKPTIKKNANIITLPLGEKGGQS